MPPEKNTTTSTAGYASITVADHLITYNPFNTYNHKNKYSKIAVATLQIFKLNDLYVSGGVRGNDDEDSDATRSSYSSKDSDEESGDDLGSASCCDEDDDYTQKQPSKEVLAKRALEKLKKPSPASFHRVDLVEYCDLETTPQNRTTVPIFTLQQRTHFPFCTAETESSKNRSTRLLLPSSSLVAIASGIHGRQFCVFNLDLQKMIGGHGGDGDDRSSTTTTIIPSNCVGFISNHYQKSPVDWFESLPDDEKRKLLEQDKQRTISEPNVSAFYHTVGTGYKLVHGKTHQHSLILYPVVDDAEDASSSNTNNNKSKSKTSSPMMSVIRYRGNYPVHLSANNRAARNVWTYKAEQAGSFDRRHTYTYFAAKSRNNKVDDLIFTTPVRNSSSKKEKKKRNINSTTDDDDKETDDESTDDTENFLEDLSSSDETLLGSSPLFSSAGKGSTIRVPRGDHFDTQRLLHLERHPVEDDTFYFVISKFNQDVAIVEHRFEAFTPHSSSIERRRDRDNGGIPAHRQRPMEKKKELFDVNRFVSPKFFCISPDRQFVYHVCEDKLRLYWLGYTYEELREDEKKREKHRRLQQEKREKLRKESAKKKTAAATKETKTTTRTRTKKINTLRLRRDQMLQSSDDSSIDENNYFETDSNDDSSNRRRKLEAFNSSSSDSTCVTSCDEDDDDSINTGSLSNISGRSELPPAIRNRDSNNATSSSGSSIDFQDRLKNGSGPVCYEFEYVIINSETNKTTRVDSSDEQHCRRFRNCTTCLAVSNFEPHKLVIGKVSASPSSSQSSSSILRCEIPIDDIKEHKNPEKVHNCLRGSLEFHENYLQTKETTFSSSYYGPHRRSLASKRTSFVVEIAFHPVHRSVMFVLYSDGIFDTYYLQSDFDKRFSSSRFTRVPLVVLRPSMNLYDWNHLAHPNDEESSVGSDSYTKVREMIKTTAKGILRELLNNDDDAYSNRNIYKGPLLLSRIADQSSIKFASSDFNASSANLQSYPYVVVHSSVTLPSHMRQHYTTSAKERFSAICRVFRLVDTTHCLMSSEKSESETKSEELTARKKIVKFELNADGSRVVGKNVFGCERKSSWSRIAVGQLIKDSFCDL